MSLKIRAGRRLESLRLWDRVSNHGKKRCDIKNADVLFLEKAGYSHSAIMQIMGIAASTVLSILRGQRRDQVLTKLKKERNGKKICSCCGERPTWKDNRYGTCQ